MVTGVVALMYDANPDLGWRDVQTILGDSARHVGSAVGGGIAGTERYAWEWNDAKPGTAAACISATTTAMAWSTPWRRCVWPRPGC